MFATVAMARVYFHSTQRTTQGGGNSPPDNHRLRNVPAIPIRRLLINQVLSATWASGPFFLTDAMPFYIPELREHMLLFRMICPLAQQG